MNYPNNVITVSACLIKRIYERDSALYSALQGDLEALGSKSGIVRRVEYILGKLGCSLEEFSDKRLEENMIQTLNREIESCPSLRLLGPVKELSILRPTVGRPVGLSAEHARAFYLLATLNFGLGNRGGLEGFNVSKECTVCAEYGMQAKLDEIHFAFR